MTITITKPGQPIGPITTTDETETEETIHLGPNHHARTVLLVADQDCELRVPAGATGYYRMVADNQVPVRLTQQETTIGITRIGSTNVNVTGIVLE